MTLYKTIVTRKPVLQKKNSYLLNNTAMIGRNKLAILINNFKINVNESNFL